MTKVSKVYRILRTYLKFCAIVIIEVDGKKQHINVDFRGGSARPHNWKGGSYSTDDALIQAAIEARSDFGDLIGLEYTSKEEPTADKTIKTTLPETELPDVIDVEEPVNAQQAREWLIVNKGVDPSKLSRKDFIIRQAKNLGITFPNLV